MAYWKLKRISIAIAVFILLLVRFNVSSIVPTVLEKESNDLSNVIPKFDKNEVVGTKFDALENDVQFTHLNIPEEKDETLTTNSYETAMEQENFVYCKENALYTSLEACVAACQSRNSSTESPASSSNKSDLFADYKYKVLLTRLISLKRYDNINATNSIIENGKAFVCLHLDTDFITCDRWFLYKNEYTLSQDGDLWVHSYKRNYKPSEYFILDGEVAVCMRDESKNLSIVRYFHIFGYSISLVALLITFIMSFMAKELKRRSNRPLQCHMLMLLFGYIILVLKHAVYGRTGMGTVCIVFSCLQQFFFLSAFFWINSQAFDLYVALKDLRPNSQADKRRQRRFIFYCLYSWGIPGIITLSTGLAEVGHFSQVTYPDFQEHCWFQISNQISAFIYYYGWMAIVLVMNTILFLLIVKKFHVMGQEVFIANKNIHKQLLRISVKLVIVMGFTWVIKVIIWAIGYIEAVTSILDLVTSLQGFFVFLVYVVKRDQLMSWLRRKIRRQQSTVESGSELSQPSGSNNTSNTTNNSVLSSFVLFATLKRHDLDKEDVLASSFPGKPISTK